MHITEVTSSAELGLDAVGHRMNLDMSLYPVQSSPEVQMPSRALNVHAIRPCAHNEL
jgi:hypothetical protein